MRKFFLLALLVTAFFIWLNRNDPGTASAANDRSATTGALAQPSPHAVSEHDWAKRSLDRTRDVTNQAREKTNDAQQP